MTVRRIAAVPDTSLAELGEAIEALPWETLVLRPVARR
jgi:hypothetical protein